MSHQGQTRFAQTVSLLAHNAYFWWLRISKYPANAHEMKYFSTLFLVYGEIELRSFGVGRGFGIGVGGCDKNPAYLQFFWMMLIIRLFSMEKL